MRVSFVIPSHNCATWLPHAVKSVQEQKTSAEVELIIVDDCSTDSTRKYLGWLNENSKKTRIHLSSTRLGRSRARNTGNQMASGEYIFVLDADDYAHPNRVKLSLEKLKNADFIYGGAEVMGPLGESLGLELADAFNLDRALETLKNRIVHSSVAYTKDFAMKYPYREGLISDLGIDDWAQQIEAARDGVKFDFSPQTLVAYRLLESAVTKTRDEIKVREVKKHFLEELSERLVTT